MVKNTSANAGDAGNASLGGEDPLEKGITSHSSILAWRITWAGAWWATVHGAAESDTT